MDNKLSALLSTMMGIVISVVASLSGNLAFTILGAALALGSAYWQYQHSKPFVKHISRQDWSGKANGKYIVIPKKIHQCGNSPNTQTFETTWRGYEEGMCAIKTNTNGDVTVFANPIFEGKIVIR